MKKKFISVLTALMVLSMSTTVFGASSPTTDTTEPSKVGTVDVAENVTTAITAVEGADADTATAAEVQDAVTNAAAVVGDGYQGTVAAVIRLSNPAAPDADGNYNIVLTVPTLSAGANVFVVHIHDDGTYERVAATVGAGGKVTFSVKDFSTFAVVEYTAVAAAELPYSPDYYENLKADAAGEAATTTTETTVTSPKTGETANVLPLMAAICLAGVVVCTRRVKFN